MPSIRDLLESSLDGRTTARLTGENGTRTIPCVEMGMSSRFFIEGQ